MSKDIVDAINSQKTLDILNYGMDAASLAPSWEAFRERLRRGLV